MHGCKRYVIQTRHQTWKALLFFETLSWVLVSYFNKQFSIFSSSLRGVYILLASKTLLLNWNCNVSLNKESLQIFYLQQNKVGLWSWLLEVIPHPKNWGYWCLTQVVLYALVWAVIDEKVCELRSKYFYYFFFFGWLEEGGGNYEFLLSLT